MTAITQKSWRAHSYQERALQFMCSHKFGALFLDPGLGKTSIALAALKKLKEQNALHRVLLIAPIRVIYEVWDKERDKWSQFADIAIANLHKIPRIKRAPVDATINMINPEQISDFLGSLDYRNFPYDTLIIDESTKFKYSSTKRFKSLKKALPHFSRRYCLTGMPCPNSLEDLWSQMFILDLGERLGKSLAKFRERYSLMELKYFGSREIPVYRVRSSAIPVIEEKISEVSISMRSEDYLDLPSIMYNPIVVSLPDKAYEHYRSLEKDLFAELDSGIEITLFSAATLTAKLRQLTSGFLYDENGQIQEIHDVKIQALEDLVAEIGAKPVIIFVSHLAEVELIRRKFKNAPYLGGGITPQKSNEIIRNWNLKEIPVLLAHPKSMGYGLNMQSGGDHIIWFSLTWSLEDYVQANARIHRQGKIGSTIVHKIICIDTIDQVMSHRLDSKSKAQLSVRQSIEYYRRKFL